MKEIKTKETNNKEIKVLNKAKNINHYEKKQDISIKQNTSDKVENEKNCAVNKVTHRGKKTVDDSVSTSRKMIRMYRRHKRNKQGKIDKQNVFEEKAALEKKPVIYREKTKLLEQHKGRIYTKERNVIRIKTNLVHVHTTIQNDKIDKRYRSKMKHFSINKYKKILFNRTKPQFRNGFRGVTNALKTSFNVVRKTMVRINNLIGSGFILLLVITLFLGVFSIFSSDSGSNTYIHPLSTEVMEYKETIEKYAKQYQVEDYVGLIQAVMMQESTGKGTNPMQMSIIPSILNNLMELLIQIIQLKWVFIIYQIV